MQPINQLLKKYDFMNLLKNLLKDIIAPIIVVVVGGGCVKKVATGVMSFKLSISCCFCLSRFRVVVNSFDRAWLWVGILPNKTNQEK
jgi:hypothetical protein